jgi:hypothetical protein
MMFRIKHFIWVALLIGLSSCSNILFKLDKQAEVKAVGVHLEFEKTISPEVQHTLEQELDKFIVRYNSERNQFNAFHANSPDSSTITIHFWKTELVSKGRQVAATFITLGGLSLPFVMLGAGAEFAVFFYYFPRALSVATISISDDIALTDGQIIPYHIYSPAYLKKQKRQIAKQGVHFNKTLDRIFTDMEKSLR